MRTVLSLLALTCFAHADDTYFNSIWRSSLDATDACWTNSSSNRALTIVHGGDWTGARVPYDSFPAFQAGYENGADAVKGDFRVNKENVGMVMHSSPIEVYESPECWGQRVEEMTTAQCEACTMLLSNYTFISASELLSWAEGKINVMFCVKEDWDLPRAISTIVEANATHRAFLEIGVGALLQAWDDEVPGVQEVYYIANTDNHDDLLTLLSSPALQRTFLVEFGDYETSWTAEQLPGDLAAVHKAGNKAAAMTNRGPVTATVQNHLDIWAAGFDVAYSYNLENAVTARQQVNTERGIAPP